MARTFVVCLNKLCEVVEVSRFDKDEEATLMLGFGALLYEEGANLSGRTLCGLAVAGVTLPRLAEKAEQVRERRKRQKLEAAGVATPVPPTERKPVPP